MKILDHINGKLVVKYHKQRIFNYGSERKKNNFKKRYKKYKFSLNRKYN